MKPVWLNKKIDLGQCSNTRRLLRGSGLQTVCEQALCPNIGECFSKGQATFLILGKYCTRFCSFCNIKKGSPEPVDAGEPQRIADAVAKLSLKHVVITSVTRDDLSDGGAEAFARTVSSIREANPSITIEILVPDLQLSLPALKTVAGCGADIVAHNVETVPSLYPVVRRGSDYNRSLSVLENIKRTQVVLKTKSGIMLGLGEKEEEVIRVFTDLREAGVKFLSIGQYLAPSLQHYRVKEYIAPERFDFYKREALRQGFEHVESGPYVRSSYMAHKYLGQ